METFSENHWPGEKGCWAASSDVFQWKGSLAHLCALCGPRSLQCAPSLSQMGFLGVKVNQSVIVAGRGTVSRTSGLEKLTY